MQIIGCIRAKVVCPDPAHSISKLAELGFQISECRIEDPLTFTFRLPRKQEKDLLDFCEKHGFDCDVHGLTGLVDRFLLLLRRPVITAGILLLLFLTFYLPGRVLFVQVEGNEALPDNLILEKAAHCGIYFGASRDAVRSEKMKNSLVQALPQLQWAGVNTKGCVAVIGVRERSSPPPNDDTRGVSSIVALRDGQITQLQVTRGSAKCAQGDFVKKGDVLISGYTDCGLTVRGQRAKGEVYAQTQRNVCMISPGKLQYRTQIDHGMKKYALLLGKNRINLYFSSGISHSTCVKMYAESYMMLPGGFRLPVALITESFDTCSLISGELDENAAEFILKHSATELLNESMIAGSIVNAEESIKREDDIWTLNGTYQCREMIGTESTEEIELPNGNTDRTDRERGAG